MVGNTHILLGLCMLLSLFAASAPMSSLRLPVPFWSYFPLILFTILPLCSFPSALVFFSASPLISSPVTSSPDLLIVVFHSVPSFQRLSVVLCGDFPSHNVVSVYLNLAFSRNFFSCCCSFSPILCLDPGLFEVDSFWTSALQSCPFPAVSSFVMFFYFYTLRAFFWCLNVFNNHEYEYACWLQSG